MADNWDDEYESGNTVNVMAASGTDGKSNSYDDYGGGDDYGAGGDDYGAENGDFGNNYSTEEKGDYGRRRDAPRVDDEKPKETYVPEDVLDDDLFDSAIGSGINFNKYDSIPVKVTGSDVPPPITEFGQSGLNQLILNNIIRSGYKVPTPIQKNAIPVLMKGRDLMACAQTGSGKTAAFLLPMIQAMISEPRECTVGSPHAIIIAPTRELIIQIYQEARKFAINTDILINRIYGGTATWHQAETMNRPFHILVATPGRLMDFCRRGWVHFDATRFLVLDEADRMLDMGFLPDVKNIVAHPTMAPKESYQTLMFSATFPEEIQRLAYEFLRNYIFITIGIVGGACTDVHQTIYEVGRFKKREKLKELLNEADPQGTLVFVETKRNADFLASFMSETTHPTTSIHGDRLQSQREQALRDFKTGKMKVLIATSVAARGLDIPNVAHVINYDLPKSVDEYVHRIGRTGRVGNHGRASSFYDPENDSSIAGDLSKILSQAGQEVPDFLGGGGYGSVGDNGFGGHDVRGRNEEASHSAPVGANGEEENWD